MKEFKSIQDFNEFVEAQGKEQVTTSHRVTREALVKEFNALVFNDEQKIEL